MTLFEAKYYSIVFGLPAAAVLLLGHVVILFIKKRWKWWVRLVYGALGMLALSVGFVFGVVDISLGYANTSEDSTFSRGAFESWFPETEVSRFREIRYYGGGFEDSYCFFRFRFESYGDVEEIIRKQGLPEVETGCRSLRSRHSRPSWCSGEEGVDYKVFCKDWDGGGATTLWIDEEKQIVYFESFTT
ncbi:hypothetical protein [Pelagicoccus mobilis]|uniref:Uncharacterized protein n=1 Tax=Pelagicoccus mobilis TaxID=415221 RepID=A0A934VTW4_9BACT|nr:hypothetical protein [Pelagicoccus mobilis]MBK1880490.1 hypothetical protein [Pelagicoccus mobilis]